MLQSTVTYRSPEIFKDFPTLIVAESTRLGGVSPIPFASLNLGLHTADTTQNVMENRHRFCTDLGIRLDQLAGAHQIHSDQILLVEKAGNYEGYDALISQQKNLFLTVTIADCVPVLIYDPVREAVAAIHAGWKGTVAGIVEKTLAKMKASFGTHSKDCYAYIGTCIDECAFEVDADVADEFAADFKRWDVVKGKFFIDLKAVNRQQLEKSGVFSKQIGISSFSTYQHNDQYFSYRREKGQTGRMLGLIGIKSGA